MMNSVAEHGRRMMRGCALGVRRALRRFARGTDGVAAVEFALIVPVVSTLFAPVTATVGVAQSSFVAGGGCVTDSEPV